MFKTIQNLNYLLFLLQIFEDRNKMIEDAIDTAELIATKSPIAVQATKKSMIYSLEHTNQEGLDHIVINIILTIL